MKTTIRLKLRHIALLLAVMLGLGGVGLAFASSASAHTHKEGLTCSEFNSTLTNYSSQGKNSVKVWVNNSLKINKNDFGTGETISLKIDAGDEVKEVVKASDDENGHKGFSFTFTGTAPPCEQVCPPAPTVTVTTSTPGPTVTVPGPTVTETIPGPTQTVPGPTVTETVPGPTQTVPGPTVTVPGEGQTVTTTITQPPVTLPPVTVTEPGVDKTVRITETEDSSGTVTATSSTETSSITSLPRTGSNALSWGIAGLIAVAVGTVLMLATRKRHQH